MIKLPRRLKFQKKYLAFFTVVPLLIVTTMVEVNCPVCDGTGHMTSNPGMENVRLVEVESEETATMYNACGMFLFYQYAIDKEPLSSISERTEETEKSTEDTEELSTISDDDWTI